MKHHIKRYALVMASASILAAFPATAANSFYAPGDLVLFFQQEGGTNTIYADLGNAATLYRGSAAGTAGQGSLTQGNILNLSSTLVSAFGANWATDPSIYAGLAGVYSTESLGSSVDPGGDPDRTLYVSAARNTVGTVGSASSTARDMTNNNGMTEAASGIQSQNNVFATQYNAQVTISLTSISQIDDQNPFLTAGIQGTAMNSLQGGIQQKGSATAFGTYAGDVGSVEFSLDLYRVLAKTNAAGQVPGALRAGSFEGNVTVGTDGVVSFLVPEPSSTAMIGLAAGALVLRRRRRSA